MINGEFFRRYHSSDQNLKKFTIDDDIIRDLKSLKSVVEDGSYHNSVLTWYHSSNDHLDKDNFIRLFPAIQFICMVGTLKDEFIKKYDVKKYHISLLRRLYIEGDDYRDSKGWIISIGYKRPFGNSYVEGDVEEEISRFMTLVKKNSDDHVEARKVLSEFVFILDKMLVEEGYILKCNSFEYDSDLFGMFDTKNIDKWSKLVSPVHPHLRNWKVDFAGIRDKTIEKILK